jgi:deoxyribodipyrimidine photolyase-related protein
MTLLRLILADQLSPTIATLRGANKSTDVILLCEVREEASYVPHHPKKIAFLFSAMRHFAEALTKAGFTVRYVKLDDPANTGSFAGEVRRALQATGASEIVVTEPGEWRVLVMFKAWDFCPVHLLPDDRFLCSRPEFAEWVGEKKQLRMEFFYREMRKKYQILLDAKGKPPFYKPLGGKWNYDSENRKPPKAGMQSPKRISHPKDAITQEVLRLVEERFGHHFGALQPFHFAVTRSQAKQEAEHFMAKLLPQFGDYQDAIVAGEAYLNHSLLSSYLNAGLLLPLELCQMAEVAYHAGTAPLNAVEGFIRQILGWREYIRGIYWHFMPEYGQQNYLNATTPLPDFYWGAPTKMFCMAESVGHTRDHAYSHHIQRLMITGNFALIAGLDVKAVQHWYLAVYSDAYEWVEMPNTLGMALFGDGGIVASKPYAASGKYIHKMSNYCEKCYYDPNEMTGEKACPFNALYWDFMVRHEDKFRGNQRMPFVFSTWDKFTDEKQAEIRAQAALSLQKMAEGNL